MFDKISSYDFVEFLYFCFKVQTIFTCFFFFILCVVSIADSFHSLELTLRVVFSIQQEFWFFHSVRRKISTINCIKLLLLPWERIWSQCSCVVRVQMECMCREWCDLCFLQQNVPDRISKVRGNIVHHVECLDIQVKIISTRRSEFMFEMKNGHRTIFLI